MIGCVSYLNAPVWALHHALFCLHEGGHADLFCKEMQAEVSLLGVVDPNIVILCQVQI